jgi:transcriptional regulator with XRE-family HTH domain
VSAQKRARRENRRAWVQLEASSCCPPPGSPALLGSASAAPCEEVKEWLLTPEAHEAIEATKARLIGLLLPEQFKELRQRYRYSQKEMGELFQVGEKSWTRWESGKQRPSRSINLLIRALYEGQVSVNYLLKLAGKPPRQESEWALKTLHMISGACQASPVASTKHSLDVIYFNKPGNPVVLQCKSPSGKHGLLGQFHKYILHETGSAKQLPAQKPRAAFQRFTRPAPSHDYPQPSLTSPTES